MKRTFKWILAVLWTAFIIYGLTKTPSDTIRFPWLAIDGVDKVIHAILFGFEALLLLLAVERFKGLTVYLLIVGWCVLLGGALELVQLQWVQGRNGDFWDLVADSFGAILVAGVMLYKAK